MNLPSQDYVDVNIRTLDLKKLLPFEYHGRIAREMTNMGEQYMDIHKGSIALKDQTTLFQVYLASEEELLELPGDVKGVLKYLFEDMKGFGNITDDACNYSGGDWGMARVKDSDRRVQWIRHPKEIIKSYDRWIARLGEDSEIKNILIPKRGYVENTCDGAYMPDTGTPFSTVETREKAEKSWTDKGYSPDFAREAVSYFYSRNENSGTACVGRCYGIGRFDVAVDCKPDIRSSRIGLFASIDSIGREGQSTGGRNTNPQPISSVRIQKDLLG